MKIIEKIITYKRLGISNMFHVAVYRLAIKLGYFQKKLPINNQFKNKPSATFFTEEAVRLDSKKITPVTLKAFGWLNVDTSQPPNWLKAIDKEVIVKNNAMHWSQLNDFDLAVGDIKTVWELSRFNWLFSFSLSYIKTNKLEHIDTLNHWLNDWSFHNPINQGVNWKCGQEASIRVMHLATTAYLLNQEKKITTDLADFLYAHLLRIAPTIRYAMAQDNNHGTSEAAALYIGSVMLEKHVKYQKNTAIKQWGKTGKYWLTNRAKKLIENDGAFSQNSVNYHRLMLDTLSLAEFFRQQFNQAEFSSNYYKKIDKAIDWLQATVSKTSGKTPILGLNDGAQLLPVTPCNYVDYRPCVQWASSLFRSKIIYDKSHPLNQLRILLPTNNKVHKSTVPSATNALNTSYQLLQNEHARCYMRTPNTKFRPACCDALHLDVWIDDENILLGTGSYSYNCEPKLQAYFTSVRSHNTVQFDQHEQMPKLSRFLYNQWIDSEVTKKSEHHLCAQYANRLGHVHKREVYLLAKSLYITDSIDGVKDQATLRWHLPNKDWRQSGNKIISEQLTIEISADTSIKQIALVEGYQSIYYLKKNKIPVIEITLSQSGTVTTLLSWS
ncbi:heparinase II/III family protein [Colwellia sp. Bg11-12]|uniref:heparinase II/III domain-containing protein n=1 Tax=Colwellia sp. Bg11-12 TaxID=2759817 RepID=UPI0015F6D057|nr:heparinase II/III family protein [Colwellia sp. Bg11-12]MBA6263215.1 alginate lyase family protein [Colwellia sp. Bg11-12]